MDPLLAITAFVCSLLAGGIAALWHVLPGNLAVRFALPENEVPSGRRGYLVGLVVLFPIVGQFVDHSNTQFLLFTGILATAVGLAWIGLARTPRACLLAAVLLAAAHAAVLVPTIVLLLNAFPLDVPGLLGPGVAVVNIGFVGSLLGWLWTPPLLTALLAKLGSRNGFLLAALGCLLPASLVAFTGRDPFQRPDAPLAVGAILDDVRCWLVLSLGFFYFALEHVIDAWRARYITQAENGSPLARVGYWIALIVARLAVGWVIWDQYEAWGLACLALLFAIVVGNLASAYSPSSSTGGLWLVAVSVGPMLPTLLATLPELFPRNEGIVIGLLFALGALGKLLLQPTLEKFADRAVLPATMRFSMMLALAWGALALVLALISNLA